MSAEDRHRSITDRIRLAAAERSMDANRLRRGLVFHRILARLSPHDLVLKGGLCLEIRLPGSARATKDVDLVGELATTTDAEQLQDTLDELLENMADNDGFTFRVERPEAMREAGTDAAAWRVMISARLDGQYFERVKLDLVGQLTELDGATEQLVVPPSVHIPGLTDVTVQAVTAYQHAAEKFHAYSRVYAGERPSTRTKDLVDLVLLRESGMLVSHDKLRERLEIVYARRDRARPPEKLATPPRSWAVPYAAMAANLALDAATLDDAHRVLTDLYAAAIKETYPT